MRKLSLTKGHSPKGFTIIEVMFTIAVLSVIVAVAAPNFFEFIQRQRVKSSGEVLAQMISEARSNALTRLTDVTICWNTTNEAIDVDDINIPANSIFSYIEAVPGIPASGTNPAVPEIPREDLTVREFGDGQTFLQDTDNDNCVVFNSQGRLDTSTVSGALLQFGMCKDGSGELDDSILITVRASGRPLVQENTGDVTALDCSG